MSKKYTEVLSFDNPYYYNEETGEFRLLRMGMVLTHRCTLKCKLCSERVPFMKEKYNPSLDDLIKQVDKYFETVDYTNKIEVSGGEVFMYKDFLGFLEHLFTFRNKFGLIRIITNATIMPTEELIQVMKKYGEAIDVLIDNYGADLSTKTYDMESVLKENNIKAIIRNYHKDDAYMDGWVDFGDLKKINNLEEAKELFSKCAVPQKIGYCFRLIDGKMDPCQVVRQAINLGDAEDTPGEYIDLFDGKTKAEQNRKFIDIMNRDVFTACMYCKGVCDDSKRYIPAEQL